MAKAGERGDFCRKTETMDTPKHRLYKDAEALFVENGLTCSAIAEQLKLTEATLSKWRRQMNWDGLRGAALAAPNKVAKALSYFDGRVALSVVVSVFIEFDNWMAGIDPAKAVEFTEYHRRFVNHRAEVDSNR